MSLTSKVVEKKAVIDLITFIYEKTCSLSLESVYIKKKKSYPWNLAMLSEYAQARTFLISDSRKLVITCSLKPQVFLKGRKFPLLLVYFFSCLSSIHVSHLKYICKDFWTYPPAPYLLFPFFSVVWLSISTFFKYVIF